MPKDFSFTITVDRYKYYSESGVYIRKHGRDSSFVAPLAHEEMSLIYDLFKKYDFMSFPLTFKTTKDASNRYPALFTTVEIIYEGERKKVMNTTSINKKVEQKRSDDFNKFCTELDKIICSNKKIRNIKYAPIIYL